VHVTIARVDPDDGAYWAPISLNARYSACQLGGATPDSRWNSPAVLIVVISLAYIEEDGLLLWFAFSAAIILVGIASAAVWGTILSALLISHI
jgi:hypothetical protein